MASLFDKVLNRMDYKRGWREECPDPDRWYFTKRGKFRTYQVTLHWSYKGVSIRRLR